MTFMVNSPTHLRDTIMAMADAVSLLVPVAAQFREVGPELAGKYFTAVGGPEAGAASVVAAVARAMDTLVTGAPATDQVTMNFAAPNGQVEITLRCGDRSSVVTHPMNANGSA